MIQMDREKTHFRSRGSRDIAQSSAVESGPPEKATTTPSPGSRGASVAEEDLQPVEKVHASGRWMVGGMEMVAVTGLEPMT